MIKNLKINNVNYNIQDGVIYRDTATEELDSATFQLLNIEKLSLEPMQSVNIEFENGTTKHLLINTWVEENATFDTNLKNYTINCISESKKLERVILPNMTITQRIDTNEEQKRKYDFYLTIITNMYIKKLYPDITIDEELLEKLSNVVAVEEQFNSPTSKEYINRILQKINCIVKLENNVIKSYDLSQKNNQINVDKLFFNNDEQSIEDYYSDIYTDLQGVQSENETVFTEIVGVRTMDSALLTDDNGVIVLSHNINFIKSIEVFAEVQTKSMGEPDQTIQYKKKIVEIVDNVIEKEQYDLMLVSNRDYEDGNNYKRNNIYFTRGNNVIEGLIYNEKSWFLSLSTSPAIMNVIRINLEKLDNNYSYAIQTQLRDLKFKVTYSAIDDVTVKFEKPLSIKSYVRDNQTDSYIDLDKFAKTQQDKINRLGNKAITITARYDSIEEVPELMDYIDNYILAEREIVYHYDYIDFKGTLYKDYVKKNLFYGVNAKKRSTQLVMGNEAVTRKELTKEKYEFAFEDKGGNKKTQRYILSNIASSFYEFDDDTNRPKPIQIVTATSFLKDGTGITYKLTPDVRKAYNSVTLNFKFYDNYSVGMMVGNIRQVGGYEQIYVPYTDNYGELYRLRFNLFDRFNYDIKSDDGEFVYSFPYIPDDLPLDYKYNFYEITNTRYKDGREILNETIQFEFSSENDIFITENFVEYLPFFNKDMPQLYVWISTEEYYDRYNKQIVVESAIMQDKDIMGISSDDYENFNKNSMLFNKILLYNNSVDLTNVRSWAIADINGNVYIAVNKRPTDDVIKRAIYLNKKED